MAITVPIVGQEISATSFGIPVADTLNAIATTRGLAIKQTQQSLPAATEVIVAWTVSSDPKGMWQSGPNGWKVPVKGIYMLHYALYVSNLVGSVQAFMKVNAGATRNCWVSGYCLNAPADCILNAADTIALNANDTIALTAYAATGATMGVGSFATYFGCQLLMPT